MMRFNGHDQRMDRSLDCATMLMECFKHKSHKFEYKMFGHSGDGPNIELVGANPPVNDKEMHKVLTNMQTHARYCMSGDNTLNAITAAVKDITKNDADEYFVLLLSDANLHQYNISPAHISEALTSDSRVNANIIFIGNLSDQADRFADAISSNAHTCFDTKALPKIIKSIFLNALQ
jgi:hypothetical protein